MGQPKQWCATHWRLIAEDRRINGICASMLVVQRIAIGVPLESRRSGEQLQAELVARYPLCCWLGDAVMDEIYAESRIVGVVERPGLERAEAEAAALIRAGLAVRTDD